MTLAYSLPDARGARLAVALTDTFERLGARSHVARGEEIYAQDDDADLLFQVVSGVVRTSRLTADGHRQVGDFYYPGDIFGLETGPDHRFAAEALSACELVAVRRASTHAEASGAELDRAIQEATRQEMERLQDHVLLLGRKGACERVASFLMSLAQGCSGDQVELSMSRQDMADYLGLTIETVSRMLSKLQAEAIVEFPSLRSFRVLSWMPLGALAGLSSRTYTPVLIDLETG